MFNFNKLKFLQFLFTQKPIKEKSKNPSQPSKGQKLTGSLKKDLEFLKNMLGTSFDIIYHEFTMGTQGRPKAVLVMIDGLVEKKVIQEHIIKPLMIDSRNVPQEHGIFPNYNINDISNTLISVENTKVITTFEEIIEAVLSGDTALLVNGLPEGLTISSRGGENRSIVEPATDSVVRGPREGFVENLSVNTALIRRRIKNPGLTFESYIVGQRTKTDVVIVYIKDIVKPGLVKEIKKRLDRINTDAILESGYIEQFIEDAPFSPFSTVGNSERPDQVAAKLLEGRAAILVNGTPIALTVPFVFFEGFQSVEDYYSRPYYASIVRLLRYLAFFISVFGPGVYVALVSFHQELIPTPLLITMAAARANTPFPAFLEALLMGMAFEILREAGIRLPRPVGTAISIVGALVIGEAVVSAGVVSSTMVIVVGITAIASFTVPAQTDVGGTGRIGLVILGGTLGAFGIIFGFLGGLIHLCSLRSFGTPYLSPVAPLSFLGLKDVFIRFPLWTMITRPACIGSNNSQRQEIGMMPAPPQDSEKAEK